jgi:hypothetical protein
MMDFRDMLSAELPALRDDEPGNLRDDILDELADHLACAYRREVIRGVDAEAARQRVLERFGDPAALARRLWLDAMRGRIMKQRILVIYSIVLTLVCVGFAGMWLIQSVAAQRQVAIAEARATEERHRAEAAQQEMFKQLTAISKAAESPKAPDWIPVTFKLTQETLDGPPAVGFHASLGKGDQGASNEGAVHRESDDSGKIEFGVVQPGDWEYTLYRGTEDGGTWRTTGKLNVMLGTTIDKTIICPSVNPPRVPLAVNIELPSDLVDRGLVVLTSLGRPGLTYQPPLHWSRDGALTLLIGPGPNRLQLIEQPTYYSWRLAGAKGGPPPPGSTMARYSGKTYLDIPSLNVARDPTEVRATMGKYRVLGLALLRPTQEHNPGLHGERYELVGNAGWSFLEKLPLVLGSPPSDMLGFHRVRAPLPPDSSLSQSPIFEARKDQPNHWTIHLPDELIEAVRTKLKDLKKP